MAVVPVLPAITSSTPWTSSQQSQVNAVVSFLLAPPRAKLVQRTLQSITTSTFTAITLDAEIYDLDIDNVGGHDNVTNNSRWTCRYPGYHLLAGGYCCDVSATGSRYALLRVNGTDQESTLGFSPGVASVATVTNTRATKIYLNAGDYVELIAWQNSGGSLNTYVGSDYARSSLDVLWVSN